MDDQKKRGYSRDHMKHLVQIILAIAVTKEHGFPIKHWVYPGNTTDVTTLPTAAKDLKTQYKEHSAILVYDRGNLSEKNVHILDEMEYDYICGLKRGIKAVRELIEAARDHGKFELVKVLDECEGYQFSYGTAVEAELWGKKRKVIVCYSEGLRETKQETRTRKLENASKALETLQKKAENRKYDHDALTIALHECTKGVKRYFETPISDHPGKTVLSFEKKESAKAVDGRRIRGIDGKLSRLQENAAQMSAEAVRGEVKKILKGQKRHFSYRVCEEGAHSTFTFKLLTDHVEEMSALDGFHAMMSTDRSISLDEVITIYDSRDVVEKSFETLKHPIRIRPIRHWVPGMVRAHVYICILGYLLRQFFLFLLRRAGLSCPLSSALVALRRVKIIQIEGSGDNGSGALMITHLSDMQKQLLDIIDVDYSEIIKSKTSL
jgi:transposase